MIEIAKLCRTLLITDGKKQSDEGAAGLVGVQPFVMCLYVLKISIQFQTLVLGQIQ